MPSATNASAHHSIPSADGAYIATLEQFSLALSSYTGALLRVFPLSQEFVSKCRGIRWFRACGPLKQDLSEQRDGQYSPHSRMLLASDDTIRVFDVNDFKWTATIEKAASNLGRIADAAFGHNPNEILVFSDFGVKLTIWSILSCRGVEIRDPKSLARCYSYRPRTGHMAILTRPAAQDILMLLDPGNHDLVKSVELPTMDAQEVAWSPDGSWLAVRDAASSGHKALIYTADGHLFRTYTGLQDAGDISLGIKRMQWNHTDGSLAFGDYNNCVTVLSKNTFSPLIVYHHTATINLPGVQIWQEQLDVSGARSYITAPQPASPPESASLSKTSSLTHGISIIAFNSHGTLMATKDDFIPTTIWIWSLKSGKAIAILIHHSPVKNVSWHPQQQDLLLIHCAIPEPAVHLWKSTWNDPRIVTLPLVRTGGRLEASWLHCPQDDAYALMLSSTHQYAKALLSSNGDIIPEEPKNDDAGGSQGTGVEDIFDEGNSLDLSPIKLTHDETMDIPEGSEVLNDHSGLGFEVGNEMIDDTFHYRRQVKAEA